MEGGVSEPSRSFQSADAVTTNGKTPRRLVWGSLLLTKHIHCIHMLSANHLWDPEDTVINELSVRLMQMALLAAFVLLANHKLIKIGMVKEGCLKIGFLIALCRYC